MDRPDLSPIVSFSKKIYAELIDGKCHVMFPWDAKMTEEQIIRNISRLFLKEHEIHVDLKNIYNAAEVGAGAGAGAL